MINKRFGSLTVKELFPERHKDRGKQYICVCDCGSTVIRRAKLLKSGANSSCGCKQYSGLNARLTHGKSKSSVYRTWKAMNQRCNNPNHASYPNYGGRGITVEWESFESFYSDMGDRPFPKAQVDRVDPDGNYSKINCRWVSNLVNANNKRGGSKVDPFKKFHFLNVEGSSEFCTRVELEKKYNIARGNVTQLILGKRKSCKGWTLA